MEILLAALLAGQNVLPTIDRHTLELQARAEALQPRNSSVTTGRPVVRRASGSDMLDLGSITTICRAAGSQSDPAGFIARLSRAYSLSAGESQSLRTSCAAYLAGSADARRAAAR